MILAGFFALISAVVYPVLLMSDEKVDSSSRDALGGFISFGALSYVLPSAGGVWVMNWFGRTFSPGWTEPVEISVATWLGSIPFGIVGSVLIFFVIRKMYKKSGH